MIKIMPYAQAANRLDLTPSHKVLEILRLRVHALGTPQIARVTRNFIQSTYNQCLLDRMNSGSLPQGPSWLGFHIKALRPVSLTGQQWILRSDLFAAIRKPRSTPFLLMLKEESEELQERFVDHVHTQVVNSTSLVIGESNVVLIESVRLLDEKLIGPYESALPSLQRDNVPFSCPAYDAAMLKREEAAARQRQLSS